MGRFAAGRAVEFYQRYDSAKLYAATMHREEAACPLVAKRMS